MMLDSLWPFIRDEGAPMEMGYPIVALTATGFERPDDGERPLLTRVYTTPMKKWLRSSTVMIALLALMASALPSSAWACLMSGRIGSAATVCKGMMPASVAPGDATSPPCAHMGGRCCKPVSLPPLSNQSSDDEKHPVTAFALAASAALTFLPAYLPTVEIAVVLPPAPRAVTPPQEWLARRNNSPPSFLSQHRPASLAGRAPPTL